MFRYKVFSSAAVLWTGHGVFKLQLVSFSWGGKPSSGRFCLLGHQGMEELGHALREAVPVPTLPI